MIFKKEIYYVRMHVDKIEIRKIGDFNTQDFYPKGNYSNDRLLIADYITAEHELRLALDELKERKAFFRYLIIIFQPMHKNISDYSHVERRAFLDSCDKAGAKEVYLYLGNENLSDDTIHDSMKKSNFIKSWE